MAQPRDSNTKRLDVRISCANAFSFNFPPCTGIGVGVGVGVWGQIQQRAEGMNLPVDSDESNSFLVPFSDRIASFPKQNTFLFVVERWLM